MVYTVVEMCLTVPPIVTDYKPLLTVAQGGLLHALHATRPAARVLAMIGHVLDGNLATLADALTWMSSHTIASNFHAAQSSRGKELTAKDWRSSNRLADHVAKTWATAAGPVGAGARLLKSARAAAKHQLALLGAVTHAANNFKVVELDAAGRSITVTRRDSVDTPLRARCCGSSARTMHAAKKDLWRSKAVAIQLAARQGF